MQAYAKVIPKRPRLRISLWPNAEAPIPLSLRHILCEFCSQADIINIINYYINDYYLNAYKPKIKEVNNEYMTKIYVIENIFETILLYDCKCPNYMINYRNLYVYDIDQYNQTNQEFIYSFIKKNDDPIKRRVGSLPKRY